MPLEARLDRGPAGERPELRALPDERPEGAPIDGQQPTQKPGPGGDAIPQSGSQCEEAHETPRRAMASRFQAIGNGADRTLAKETMMQMFNTVIGSFAALGLMAGVAMAATSADADRLHAASIAACTAVNAYQPVEVVAAVDDGRGNSLVWLEDIDGDLWMCNANRRGAIYAYEFVDHDWLDGEGAELIGLAQASYEPGMPRPNPMRIAERVCLQFLENLDDRSAQVISTHPDGLGDYTVFIEDGDGDLILCNASGDAAIFAVALIGEPLDLMPTS